MFSPSMIRQINGSTVQRDMRGLVMAKQPFAGCNVKGERRAGGSYVVVSYGEHWPLFIFYRGKWFGNHDRASVSTTGHCSATEPWGVTIIWKSCDQMRAKLRQIELMKLAQIYGGLTTDQKREYTRCQRVFRAPAPKPQRIDYSGERIS